jgi:hypothetical protein
MTNLTISLQYESCRLNSIEGIKKLPSLKTLDIHGVSFPADILPSLFTSCKQLTSLKLALSFDLARKYEQVDPLIQTKLTTLCLYTKEQGRSRETLKNLTYPFILNQKTLKKLDLDADMTISELEALKASLPETHVLILTD